MGLFPGGKAGIERDQCQPIEKDLQSVSRRELCGELTNAHIRSCPPKGPVGADTNQEGRLMSSEQVKEIVAQMGGAIGASSGLGGTLKFDFGEPGSVYIDGKSDPNTVSDGDGKTADCTISLSLETFEKMVKGELDGTSAFMQGKLRVAGDMGLAMKLGPILQKARG
jgi:putative sterol carrier protein